MSVLAAAAIGGKARDDHVGAKGANHPHHVGQNLLLAPELKGFPVILGKTKILGAREELPATVHPPRRQQFLRADYPEFIPDFRPEHILPAVAARD